MLVVDDSRSAPDGAIVKRGNDSAIAYLESIAGGPEDARYIDELWLDYNLGYRVTTEETARWLVANEQSDRAIAIDWVLIHSNDQIGTNGLLKLLAPQFGDRVAGGAVLGS